MRIPFAAVVSFILVGIIRVVAWLMSSISHALSMLYATSPSVCWTLCMVPAMLGAAMLWRVFQLMERPARLLTLTQGASALEHHRKELHGAGLAAALLSVSAGLAVAFNDATATAPAPLLGVVFFISISLVFALALLALAGFRLRKVTRFVQHNPLFG